MDRDTGLSFFIPFNELSPSGLATCIFFTKEGKRCGSRRRKADESTAIELYETIHTSLDDTLCLELLREYILCNCCIFARHKDRIKDRGLLLPLAQRWLSEIRANNSFMMSVSKLKDSTNIGNSYADSSTSRPTDTTALSRSNANSLCNKLSRGFASAENAAPRNPVADSLFYQPNALRNPSLVDSGSTTLESQPRYNFRHRNTSSKHAAALFDSSYQPPQSEFRPHIIHPKPQDSVFCKIVNSLKGRDLKTGSLYIFERTSSPGYVKIGWTAKSVSSRLQEWSKCGYRPDLLFSVNDVPHAQRVETLAHYELIKEWRRERMCKALWCLKSHQEWFETNKARAQQVVANWADFMKRAQPYDSKGQLKGPWRTIVEKIDGDGDLVTAKTLLERYEEFFADTPLSQPEIQSTGGPIRNKASSSQTTGVKDEKLHKGSPLALLPTLQPNLWDAAAIPVENGTSGSLETAALKAVNGLCNEIFPNGTNFDVNGLGTPAGWKYEGLRAIEACA